VLVIFVLGKEDMVVDLGSYMLGKPQEREWLRRSDHKGEVARIRTVFKHDLRDSLALYGKHGK